MIDSLFLMPVFMFAMLFIAVITDIKKGMIYNWCTLTGALLGFILNFIQGGLPGLGNSVLGFFVGLGLLFIPFALGGIGAGDVKLLAACGAFMGPIFAVKSFLFGAIFGALMGVGYTLFKKGSKGIKEMALSIMSGMAFVQSFKGRKVKENLPYGVAVATGAILAYFIHI